MLSLLLIPLLLLAGCGPLFPPASVTDFTAVPGVRRVTLTWTNPADRDLAGIRIQRRIGSFPTSPEDGVFVYDGLGTTHTEMELAPGQEYHYAAFSYDRYGNHAPAAGLVVRIPE
ncbi:MAG: hypothetical protein GX580_04140 [Candidatus Hydrogenedens sp.]|nr:hypothetical protein [Candidatus Hydrogenedentota bacterium]NLF56810.1 hypothetical protein [Candidatus Hydrogenedens sp.]